MSKYLILFLFCSELNNFINTKPRKGCTKDKKATVYNNASEIYNDYLEIYFNQYMTRLDAKRRKLSDNYNPEKLFLERYDYSVVSENKE